MTRRNNMIYFDNSATTIPDDRVLDTFNKTSINYPGNANSLHSLGIKSKELESYATSKIGKILDLRNKEIIYTSGATESNNMVLKGIASKYKSRGNHIIISPLEHSSVTKTCSYLESKGFVISYVKLNSDGRIDLEDFKNLINDKTILVAISLVDSELGIKQDIKEIKKICDNYPKCYLHVDGTQAIGKIDIDFDDMDFFSMSGHKIFGLKGIGLLIKKDSIVIDNLIHGGKSTTEYRSGTPPLPLITSLMRAIELVTANILDNYDYVWKLNKKITDSLKKYDNVHINSTEKSIPYIINFSIKGVKPETFIHAMEEENIFISTRSACSIGDYSRAVYAVYKDKDIASSSIRISLSYKNTMEEVLEFNKIFDQVYNKLLLR